MAVLAWLGSLALSFLMGRRMAQQEPSYQDGYRDAARDLHAECKRRGLM